MLRFRRRLSNGNYDYPKVVAAIIIVLGGLTSAKGNEGREAFYNDYALRGAEAYLAGKGYIYKPERSPKERAASDVAVTAQIFVEAYRRDKNSRWLPAIRAAADSLIEHPDMDGDGKLGWGRYWASDAAKGDSSGGATAFARGCSLPRDQAYSDDFYDIARISFFLLSASEVTKDPKYALVARKSIDDSWSYGSKTLDDLGYSYHKTSGPCSNGWHVKNINMLMAIPISILSKQSNGKIYLDRLNKMIFEEKSNFKNIINLGYYSITTSDSKGSTGDYVPSAQIVSGRRIICRPKTGSGESCSAHLGIEAVALFLVGRNQGDSDLYRPEIMSLMNGFLESDRVLCEADKTPAGAKPLTTSCIAYFCALRRFDKRFDDRCYSRILTQSPRPQDLYLGLFWGHFSQF